MNAIINGLKRLRSVLKIIGAVSLVGMMVLTCADVVGRYLGHPIFGSVEIVGYLAVMTAIMSLAYTHKEKGHIGVEILVRNFSKHTQDGIEIFTHVIGAVLSGVITWRMFLYAGTIRRSGEVSMNLELPEHIIIYVASFCFFVLLLTMIEEIVAATKRLMGTQ